MRLSLLASLAFSVLLLAVPAPSAAQQADSAPTMENHVPATPSDARLRGYARRQELMQASLVQDVPTVNIGPTVMSGRVVDLAVHPDDPTTFYVAYASGGLWRTTNNGLSFEPLFDHEAVMTIGDIAVDWANDVLWVGTGENNSSRSSYAGTGLYRSDDGGVTWTHKGLADTQRTGRIVLHPTDPNTVWVAALGPLYSESDARGVYKSTDGGDTWTQTLFVDPNTGAIDLVMDPADPSVLYAAMWERARRAWNFVEGGDGSGLYRSDDGGTTWSLLSTPESGFPTGEGVGRIGLAVSPANPDIVYALLDNQARRPEEEPDEDEALTRDALRTMARDELLEAGEEAVETYLRENGFPAAYTGASILQMVRDGELEPLALVEYLEDANQQLFDTPVVGAEVYRSEDGGRTWQRTHDAFLDDVYYSYGYYFGEIRVAPHDAERIYIMGVPILRSDDGGATFVSINEENVHVDHHALWVNPHRPGHLVNGNDGGVNISYDDGATWYKANVPPVGQFYAVQVDAAEPYQVYGGLQDNGVWVGPHAYEHDYRWYAEGDYPYDRLLGGDGMHIEVDTRTNDVVYTGFQFGNYVRIDQATGQRTSIKPRHELGERPLRFNWQTPIHLSRHNQDILYLGSNKFHRSMNRGDDWTTLSGDLTRGGQPGDVPYGTLTSIDESPLRFGLLIAGTDDGLVHVSRDGGLNWEDVSGGLPPHWWVSRVETSHHEEGRFYVTLNGYRWDNFEPHLYRTDDYGRTWTRLGTTLPFEPLNVVLEDPERPEVLYVGSDHAVYVSLDGGETFMGLGQMPNAPVHDLKLQHTAEDLLVGTHGRSIFRVDVSHLRDLTTDRLSEPLYAFEMAPIEHRANWGSSWSAWIEAPVPDVHIAYLAGQDGPVSVEVRTEDDRVVQRLSDDAQRGLNYLGYDLSIDPELLDRFNERRRKVDQEPVEAADNGVAYLPTGTYSLVIRQGDATVSTTLELEGGEEEDTAEPRMEPEGTDKIK